MSDSNEREWKDVNPITEDLPNKGRTVIFCIVGGIVIGVLGIIGARIKPIGLAIGSFAFFTGIGMFIRMRIQQRQNLKPNIKIAAIITATGFLMLLAHPRFGLIAPFAIYILITGAIGLVVFGIWKAIKLSWDLWKKP